MGDGATFLSKRSRKRVERLTNIDDDADCVEEVNRTEIISFNYGESPLHLISRAKCFDRNNCAEFDQILIGSPLWWHQVIVSRQLTGISRNC